MLTRKQLEAPLQHVARSLDQALPIMIGVQQQVGFALFVFNFGEGGNIAYVSNSSREDMVSAVKEWLVKQEAGLTTDPPGPKADA